jgi:integrase
MQHGSLSREQRKRSSDAWCYRWWEPGPTGRRIHRRIILGTVERLHDKRAANQATVGLRREINSHDIRTKTTLMTVAELADHFRQRELLDNNMRITYSTKKAYAGYLAKWIVPRWGQNALQHIKAREVELWLGSVQRARSTRAKIRNVMSVLFNHARRYDLFDGNPIKWVRQSAKGRSAPNVLTIEEVRRLLAALPPRERTLVFLDVSTGLRQSELFGLQWQDIRAPVSGPLYPSRGHLQPSSGFVYERENHFPLARLCSPQRTEAHDLTDRRVPTPLPVAPAPQRVRADQELWLSGQPPTRHASASLLSIA